MNQVVELEVTRYEWPDHQRAAFFPHYLKRRAACAQLAVVRWAKLLFPAYTTSGWRFYGLEGKGFYVAPVLCHDEQIEVGGHRMSADAFGVLVTLAALEEMGESDLYTALHGFACLHDEARAILGGGQVAHDALISADIAF
ncbi:antirestriction protein [Burkholderia multivorans]|uniref:antirestriction protein n=1 Tax=Burkholderia multivorans TaxID=87883 RepID=UPI000AFD279D|nr:antirestriction protein [Burkholderia multivorans]MBU9651074.1 antirestriction protein [Burkholderia multivorans]MCO1451080.1 antirestriction protein [Burkholderia multivorans]MDN8103986.1 antirestriction protein [Burkholderia multivorans]